MTERTKETTGHVGGLDGARAVAAYGVIATHVGFNTGRSLDDRPLAPFLARLDFGVTIFFLLSGFLLFRPFATAAMSGQAAPRLGAFWWRRALRILPAYWIVVVVTLAVLSYRHATGGDWWSYLLMIQTYNGHDVDASLVQMWTLVVEIAFYAALPLLAALPRVMPRRLTPVRRQLVLLVAMALVALSSNIVWHTVGGPGAAQLWLPTYLDWFALGMFLAVASCLVPGHARWRRVLGDWADAPGTCWIAGALLFWISTLPLGGPRNLIPATAWEWTIKHYLYGAAAFFFLLPVMLGSERAWSQRVLSHRFSRWLGEISYGVYLWHLPFLIFIQRRIGWPVFGGHFIELFALTSLSATAAAAVSYYLIERPLLRRYSRSWRPGRQQRGNDQGDRDEAQQLHPAGTGQRSG
jgi:peptidoglycan/LPS O-acetylase OafA/YrhL